MRIRTRKDLGQLIREMRRGLGLTQAQLAEIVGVNRRWVVQVEQGKTSADLRTLLRALRAVGAELHLSPMRTSAAAKELNEIVDARRGSARD
ncbi:MAG: helix-turn-helix domain-containing protein [Gemmatimonadaceae bacterium]